MKTQPSLRGVRVAVVILAIAVPLIPVGFWLYSVAPIYSSMWHGPMLLLYLPARALGLVGFVLMTYQFVLSARFDLIERAFTRAVLYRRHRTLGMIGFFLIALHATAMLAFDLFVAGQLLFDTSKLWGLVALILLTIAVAAAVFWKPLRLSNRQWMWIHRLTYLVLPAAFYHAVSIGTTLRTSLWVMGLFYSLGLVYLIVVGKRVHRAFVTGR